MRVLRQFVKPGHVVQICERTVPAFSGLEYIVLVDESLLDSEIFHGARLRDYSQALEARAKQFLDDAWIEQPMPGSSSSLRGDCCYRLASSFSEPRSRRISGSWKSVPFRLLQN